MNVNTEINLLIVVFFVALGVWYLIKLNREFSLKLFYELGFWAFMIIGGANSLKIFFLWDKIPGLDVLIMVMSTLFNFGLATLFFWFARQEKEKMNNELNEVDNIEELFNGEKTA